MNILEFDHKKTEVSEARKGSHKDDDYFATVDPKTGRRFNIPMLSTKDKQYFVKYVKYMKIREQKPEYFEKILNWE